MSTPECTSVCRRAKSSLTRNECSFQVAWAINPHMRIGSVDAPLATRQHRELVQLLHRLGASVDAVPFVHGAYDSVFMKDNAVLRQKNGEPHALLAAPRFAERRIEQPARQRALHGRGFRVHADPGAAFEGGDVVILPHAQGALLGTGFRSERRAAPMLASFLETDVHALSLRDPHLYHLDTALTALDDGTIAFCPDAFTKPSLAWIEAMFPRASLIRVPYADACAFALNIIEVGMHVILGGPSPWLTARLEERGFIVHTPDLTEFRRAGGSAACLVSKVQDETVVTSRRLLETQAA